MKTGQHINGIEIDDSSVISGTDVKRCMTYEHQKTSYSMTIAGETHTFSQTTREVVHNPGYSVDLVIDENSSTHVVLSEQAAWDLVTKLTNLLRKTQLG